MSEGLREILRYDLMPVLGAVLASLACALIGNFLVLRRQAMLADAISHAVLPGLAVAFILTGDNTTFPMLAGAAVAAVAAAALIEIVRRAAGLGADASMGVVFSVMFALGVVLISLAARNTHVDANCVLYGQLEHLTLSGWRPPDTLAGLLTPAGWAGTPRQVGTLALCVLLVAGAIGLLFKELRLVSFDPQLASALGFRAGVIDLCVMVLVALAVVASFEAVGVILVVAMLICPPAMARLLTDRLRTQVLLSACIGVGLALAGYWVATRGVALALPGDRVSGVPAAGTIAALGGLGVVVLALVAPSHGVIGRRVRQAAHRLRVAREDMLGLLFRIDEVRSGAPEGAVLPGDSATLVRASARTTTERIAARIALRQLLRRAQVTRSGGRFALTGAGRDVAADLVRSHRLWESYLVGELGLRPDHVHDTAMILEHITSPAMAERLRARAEGRTLDPHGREIP